MGRFIREDCPAKSVCWDKLIYGHVACEVCSKHLDVYPWMKKPRHDTPIEENVVATSSEPKIKEIIFNGPATIVFWPDGTKTVVKCDPRDEFDPEKGLAMACAKKLLGDDFYTEYFKPCI